MNTDQAVASGAALAPDDDLGTGFAPDSDDAARRPTDEPDTTDQGSYDPFADIVDEIPDVGGTARAEFLSRRGFTPVRHVFVQHMPGTPQRPSTLGALVSARQPRAILLYLLLLACGHRLRSDPKLPAATWARMLATAHYPCSTAQFRKAIVVLQDMGLAHARWSGTRVELVACTEDGNDEVREEPTGEDGNEDLRAYFTLPNEFFSDEVLDQLTLPGIAMLLMGLKETSKSAVFSISGERVQEWYGWSERTAERGYRELAAAGLIDVHKQTKKDSRAPRGVTTKYHRTLLGIFGTQSRNDLRSAAQRAATAKLAKEKAGQKRKTSAEKMAATDSGVTS